MKAYWIQSTRTEATLQPSRVWILLLGGGAERGRQFKVLDSLIWAVPKIIGLFWFMIVLRHLRFRVTKTGLLVLGTTPMQPIIL